MCAPRLERLVFLLAVVCLPVIVVAQTQPSASATPDKPRLKQEELEQILAPIALYPDSLLSQIFMAATYPLEIVQAQRWADQNKSLKDAALTAELETQDWDPSVKSLVNFPQVLEMMSSKLDVTIKLGDAFIGQQADVMNTVQKLRAKAQAEGNLKTNEQQRVIVEQPPPPAETTVIVEQVTPPPAQIIRIEPAQPEVIYVPSYSPTHVYGGWPYPAYPPYPYYPPGYVASNVISFGFGVACGAAWGYAWGNCNWGGCDVDIDIDRTPTSIETSTAPSTSRTCRTAREIDRVTGRPARESFSMTRPIAKARLIATTARPSAMGADRILRRRGHATPIAGGPRPDGRIWPAVAQANSAGEILA